MSEFVETEEVEEIGLIGKLVRGLGSLMGIGDTGLTDLEERLRRVTNSEKMKIRRDSLLPWGMLVHDSNRLHWVLETAKKMGFEDTPVQGSRIAAHAEKYVLSLLKEINITNGRKFTYEGHGIYYLKPLFPGVVARWNLKKVLLNEEDKSIRLDISAINSKEDVVVDCPGVKLSLEREQPRVADIVPFSLENVLKRKKISITSEELDFYYNFLGKENNGEGIPMMYPASFIVSSLLDAVSEKTGRPEGVLRGMDLVFHHQPKFGSKGEPAIIDTSVISSSKPREVGDVYLYNFKALCSQEGEPILSGKIRAFSKYKLGEEVKSSELNVS
jgi:hypothetical protein